MLPRLTLQKEIYECFLVSNLEKCVGIRLNFRFKNKTILQSQGTFTQLKNQF